MDQLERDIYDLWSELEPHIAYQCGAQNRVGQFFNPSEENIQRILGTINELKVDTIDSVNLSLFKYFETKLKFLEPHQVLWRALWAYFYYLVKEGINISHQKTLTGNIIKAVNTVHQRLSAKSCSIEKKIITMNNYLGLIGILDSIQKEAPEIRPIFNELRNELKKFMKKYTVPGIKHGDFSEIYPILKSKGGNIGRKDYYPELLQNIWGYLESTAEIESKALLWLNEEKPKLQMITDKLANIFDIEPTIESVSEKISNRSIIDSKNIIEIIEKIRKPLRKIIEKDIVRITPQYDTRVMATPNYLLNFISTAAMTPYNIHTEKPFNIFYVTTDPKRSPATSLSAIFQLIIHEEFGHCVHFSNSATKFNAKPTSTELLYTDLAFPISDGISFYREWEVYMILKRIIEKPEHELDKVEQELINVIKTYNNPNLFVLEFEFVILNWRIIRFLRAIGDIRINMHKQTISEFIAWASEYVGLSKKAIFDQIFLFQTRPGYAPCYSISGERIRELQNKAKARGRKEIDFNSFSSSLGFPPRTVFEQKLNEF